MADANREQQYYVDIVSGLAERTIKRLWIVIILLIVLLVGTNVAWLVYESSFEEITTTEQTVTQESDNGNNSFVGGDYYGEANGQN